MPVTMASWADFIKSVEVVPPDEAAIATVAAIFTDKLKAAIPVQAEGISEAELNEQLQAVDVHVIALARRTLRNVEAAAVARRAQTVPLLSGQSVVAASAKTLATALAPSRTVDVADLLTKHNLTAAIFGRCSAAGFGRLRAAFHEFPTCPGGG